MAEGIWAQIWLGRLFYLGSMLVLIFLSLVPVDFQPSRGAGPDLAFGLTAAVMLRRPDTLPVLLVAGIFLLMDMLGQRPPGLWAAIMVLVFEFARLQEYRFRELSFLLEWMFVAAILFLALLAERAVLMLSMVPQVGFAQVVLNYLISVATYPLVVGFCVFVLRIRKLSPQEAVQYGHRL